MALLGNYSVYHKSPASFMAGQSVSDVRSNNNKVGISRSPYSYGNFSNMNSVPNGSRPPYSWIIPQKTGGLAAYTSVQGLGVYSNSNLAGGVNGNTSSPNTILGSGSITSADLALIMFMVAIINGTGNFDFPPNISGVIKAIANLQGSGSVSNPVLGAILDAVANLLGSGNLSTANMVATAYIEASILPYTELSPQSLAQAVMASIVETGMDLTQAMKLLTAVSAGKTAIVNLGGGTATVTFRDVNDTTDRVVADMTNSDRTTVTLTL